MSLPLGGAFHSQRLTIRSSQVGTVAPRRRGTRTHGRSTALALGLLADPAFDALLTGDSPWRDCRPSWRPSPTDPSPGLCHTIDWRDA